MTVERTAGHVWPRPPEAVFLDRDGVINENRPEHVKSWSEFRFLPGALEAIARLARAGIRVFVVTNQAIINRGLVSSADVEALHRQMQREVERHAGDIVAVAACPHRPDERCACRKPQPGLLLDLAQAYGVHLEQSVSIGDAVADLEAGCAAGCRPILVLTGRGAKQLTIARERGLTGFMVVPDLAAAADLLLGANPTR